MNLLKPCYLFLSGILFSLSGVFGQSVKLDFKEYDQSNGLHVILQEDHSTPIVVLSIMYHVGSKNENPERTGFAHLFEHLMFEGSDNIPRGEYTRYVEKAGGTLNANTAFDRTYFYEVLPSHQLKLGLWLESERMLHLKLDSLSISTQKGVVIEEIKQREENTPYGSLLREVLRRAYHVHPYRWPVLGSAAQIKESTDQDVQQFYHTFYVPDNAVLTLAGDFDPAEAKEWIKYYFGTISKGKGVIPRPPADEPPLNGEIRDTVYDRIQLPAIVQAYRVPAMGTDDYYAVSLLNTLLSGGESSRFTKALVDEQQLALQAVSVPMPLEQPGITLTLLLPNIGVDLTKLEQAADQVVEQLQTDLIPQKEFQKLMNQTEAGMINRLASLESRAELLATAYTYYGETNRVNTEIDRYLGLTREDLRQAARTYFRKDNRVVLYYLPKSKQKKQ
ncbi:MAG: insulinase family protein [Bacteroidales bacterium]|nr:insulinase family protein [Bacteroidales bacterium]